MKLWRTGVKRVKCWLFFFFFSSPDLVLVFLFFAGPREAGHLGCIIRTLSPSGFHQFPAIGEAPEGGGESETGVFILSAPSLTGEVWAVSTFLYLRPQLPLAALPVAMFMLGSLTPLALHVPSGLGAVTAPQHCQFPGCFIVFLVPVTLPTPL